MEAISFAALVFVTVGASLKLYDRIQQDFGQPSNRPSPTPADDLVPELTGPPGPLSVHF